MDNFSFSEKKNVNQYFYCNFAIVPLCLLIKKFIRLSGLRLQQASARVVETNVE